MDIAKDLALIDLLCTLDFPAEHGGTDVGRGGPGYHIARLGPDDWPGAEDCYAYETGIGERLTERWGEPSRWGTVTLGERLARGEHLAEPWATLNAQASDLCTWQANGTGRSITVAVADREDENRPQPFVVVTDLNPR
ncbi:hypothetical protein ACIHFB_05685 [Streptomyces sp. NPDC051963]|uniref:hypothetical protein n=1 Tax=Streptomyces sp. NPDC051963 TaxID=3365678 RepID=UPI0037D492A5